MAKRGKKPKKVEVFKGRDGSWWWRAVAKNGAEVGRSEQGYVRRAYCRGRASVLFPDLPIVNVESK